LSGPSSPMHIVQQHPLAAVSSTTVNPLPVRTTNVDKRYVQSVAACHSVCIVKKNFVA